MPIFQRLLILLLFSPLSLPACENEDSIKFYQVKWGDTLINISTKLDCDYHAIARWNNIQPPYRIAVGQKLQLFKQPPTLDKSSITFATVPIPIDKPITISTQKFSKLISKQPLKAFIFKTYQVKKGDTLYSISRQFAVNHKLIAVTNNLLISAQLNIGQELKIPNTKQKHNLLNLAKQRQAIIENLQFNQQKNSIISNNNENMLKLYRQWPITGKILKTFIQTGFRGIEIRGQIGQKVTAVAAGKVVAVNASIYGHGKFVVIQHNYFYMSSYANNQRTLVKRGQQVRQGQVIAELGAIGYKPPLLKFEIRKAGKLINPMYFLPKR
jgi:lipoprotein NlpD